MIEEKVDSEENISLDNSVLDKMYYPSNIAVDLNNPSKEYSKYHKIHIREIFYKFRGKHIFPDRG